MNAKLLKIYASILSVLISQQVQATNGDVRVGLNALDTGMANAVVAKPESSATIFNNPAGLSEIEIKNMRMDLGFALMNPPRSVNNNDSDSNLFFMPTGSVAFEVSEKVTVGMGFAALAGFGMDVLDALPTPGNQSFVTTKELLKFAPSLSYKISDGTSIGASMDIYSQSLALATPGFSMPQNRQFGFGATFGLMHKFNDSFQMGVSYATEGNMSAHEFNTNAGKFKLDMDHPDIITVGAAYTFDSGAVIEGDIKQINFSTVRDSVDFERPSGYTGPVPASLNFGWEDQTVFAVGVRKKMSEKLTLRAGFNYGASPIAPEDVNNNLGAPAIVEKHLTIGMTRKFNKHMSSNIAFTHSFENEVKSSSSPNAIKMYQNVLTFNITMEY